MSKITTGQISEVILKEGRGEFGGESSEDIQWLMANGGQNWRSLRGLRTGSLLIVGATTKSPEPPPVKVVSEWSKLFGHMRIWDSNFNEDNFPLEPEAELREVITQEFEGMATGYERLAWGESQGLELSLPCATGLYLKARPQLQLEHPVIGGGRWAGGDGDVCVPIFSRCDGQPDVGLGRLVFDFGPGCVWLFSRKSSGV